ncbi:hypothetical protein [Puniceibacterium sediminis]|uniref:N-acetyltransferase domain-containing protein n=1 Tax=Puniceibacterium sediminis TaxID=1608407 RepID=A0A238Y9S9_9RHOB|nr:hypothetical protein [Puniceibacterium sediminis]SNR67907.1 hypothetical protein SAMN06265370_115100 [Puniceibacterium sediminis]
MYWSSTSAPLVRQDQQDRGLGTALLLDALRPCLGISGQIKCSAIVLNLLRDAVVERRWRFYTDLGFQSLNDPENPTRVFIPLADLPTTFG